MAGVVLALLGALTFPVVCLAFLLWLSHLEETLGRDVQRAVRKPAPPPILAVPERDALRIPEQRSAPTLETAPMGSPPPGRAG